MENVHLTYFKIAKRHLNEAETGKFTFEETEHYLLGLAEGIYLYEKDLQKNERIRSVVEEFAKLYKGTPEEKESATRFFKYGPDNRFMLN